MALTLLIWEISSLLFATMNWATGLLKVYSLVRPYVTYFTLRVHKNKGNSG